MVKKLKMVYVSSPMCGPCKAFWSVVEKTCFQLNVPLFKEEVTPQNKEFAIKHNINSVPTMLIFDGDEVVRTVTGTMNQAELIELLTNI